jgi:beta-N-acetylhexosaminidase
MHPVDFVTKWTGVARTERSAAPQHIRDHSAVLGQLMLAFDGTQLPEPMATRLRDRPAAGVTLFRHANVQDPGQLRELTDAIQRQAPAGLPFLVAIDQEGGQLSGLGAASTPFAGAMALGAVGDKELAERVGAAIGRELRAAGVNVNYAPVCDLATNPANPALGVRAFGDDPDRVAALVAAVVRGHAASGVAATLKHFPGIGEISADTHHGAVAVGVDAERLRARELLPFRAGIDVGAAMVMTGHAAVPALTGRDDLPATVAAPVVTDLLRDELGFTGVAISDALNMRALAQDDAGRAIEAIAALRAGLDLLLLTAGAEGAGLEDALVLAASRGLLPADRVATSLDRVARLRRALSTAPADGEPETSVIGSSAHRALADELARRSITLVRNDAGLLPLQLDPAAEVFVVMPQPADLTPADTSSTVAPGLADAIRRHHARVSAQVVAQDPDPAEITAVRAAAASAEVIVVGTISASLQPGQVALVEALLSLGRPTVTVALRTPWDLEAYPAATTHACTYSVLEPSLTALADALFGLAPFPGGLPVRLAARAASR